MCSDAGHFSPRARFFLVITDLLEGRPPNFPMNDHPASTPQPPSRGFLRLARHVTLCSLIAAAAATALAQTPSIMWVELSAVGHFNQTSNTTAGLQGATLDTYVYGTGLSSSTASFVVPSGTQAGTVNLAYQAGAGGLTFSSAPFSSAVTLRAAYGGGAYSYTVNGTGLPANFGLATAATAALLPTVPLGTISGSPITNSVATVDANQSFTLTTNTWTTNYVSGHAFIGISISGPGVNLNYATAPAFNTNGYNYDQNQLSLTLPAFSLTSGQSYNVAIAFSVLVDANTTGTANLGSADTTTISGASVIADFSRNTGFTIQAVPEPSTYALAAGASAIALAIVRRRRKAVALSSPA